MADDKDIGKTMAVADRNDQRLLDAKKNLAELTGKAKKAWENVNTLVSIIGAYEFAHRDLQGTWWNDTDRALVRFNMQARFDMLIADSGIINMEEGTYNMGGLRTVEALEDTGRKAGLFLQRCDEFKSELEYGIETGQVKTLPEIDKSLAAVASMMKSGTMIKKSKAALQRTDLLLQKAKKVKKSEYDERYFEKLESASGKIRKQLEADVASSEQTILTLLRRAVALEAIARNDAKEMLGMEIPQKNQKPKGERREEEEAPQEIRLIPKSPPQNGIAAQKPNKRRNWIIAAAAIAASISIGLIFSVFKTDKPPEAQAVFAQEVAVPGSVQAQADSIAQVKALEAQQARADSIAQAKAAEAQAMAQTQKDSVAMSEALRAQADSVAQAKIANENARRAQTQTQLDAASQKVVIAAERGEGVWHLAKKAISRFFGEGAATNANVAKLKNAVLSSPGGFGITRGDILDGHEGGFWLVLGAKVAFSRGSVAGALGFASNETPQFPSTQQQTPTGDISSQKDASSEKQNGVAPGQALYQMVEIGGENIPMLCVGGGITINADAGEGIWVVARKTHKQLTGSDGYGAQEQSAIRAIAKELAAQKVYGVAGSLKESENYKGGFYFRKNTVIALDRACLSEISSVVAKRFNRMPRRPAAGKTGVLPSPKLKLAA